MSKDYRNDAIVVHWDAARCIHTGICTRGLPQVFDITQRPWISVDGATADQIAETVTACPTGALRYTRLDGGAPEASDEATTVIPMRNGPLYLRGRVRVQTAEGEVLAEEGRLALCRCGASANPPFCDNSHRAAGYRSPEIATSAGPDLASPADICQPQDF